MIAPSLGSAARPGVTPGAGRFFVGVFVLKYLSQWVRTRIMLFGSLPQRRWRRAAEAEWNRANAVIEKERTVKPAEPVYIGSMFIENNSPDGHEVIEVAMMDIGGSRMVPGGIRNAQTFRKPTGPPSATQMRHAIWMSHWCMENSDVFDGKVSYKGKKENKED